MSDYLLFSLHSVRYAIDASTVREIFWLPELSPIEEGPSYIAGIINLRGQILPVMSLDLRFQHSQKTVQLSNQVIVVQIEDLKIGMIVSEVHDVMPIAALNIEPVLRFNLHTDAGIHFIAGEAKIADTIWMILDFNSLIDAPDLHLQATDVSTSIELFENLSAEERSIFQTRANQLAQNSENQTVINQQAFVIIQLGLELYAIAAQEVREFCHIRQVTPIPCCPHHFIGNMNLRGDILTLIDVRSILSLVVDADVTEVMVIESEDLRVGIPVTKVLDVIYLTAAEHLPLPNYANEVNQDYCSSAIYYNNHLASVLDIKSLLTKGGLEVDENV